MDTVIISDIPLITEPEALPFDHPLRKAAGALRSGELVVFPTETVYGLGANALDPEAVMSVYKVKGRPSDNPLIVHIADTSVIRSLVKEIPEYVETMITDLMPGPVTLVFRKSELIPIEVTSGLDTVAIRVPSHPVARLFLSLAGVPVAAPSANISGSPSPTDVSHAIDDLSGRISYIIDGGASDVGLESTVIDVTGDHPVILRPGSVSADDILKYHNNVEYSSGSPDRPRSPGMKYRHYAPSAKVISAGPYDSFDETVSSIAEKVIDLNRDNMKVAVYAGDQVIKALKERKVLAETIVYGSSGGVKAAAAGLFAAFRKADIMGSQVLVVEAFREDGIGKAYMNRLNKAAQDDGVVSETGIAGKLVFVCTGNTCRSPMAEYLFNAAMSGSGGTATMASSAGIGTIGGMMASEGALKAMNELFGIDMSAHRSSVLKDDMIENNDLILTMTGRQKEILRRDFPGLAHKIHTLYGFVRGSDRDISDPYAQSDETYRATALEIKALTDELIIRSDIIK